MCGETQKFRESQNLKSETKICQSFQCKLFGNPSLPTIQICDTPGFMDSSGSDCGTIETIFDLLDSIQDNGIQIILFCLSATEVKCDKSVLDTLKKLVFLMGDLVQGSIFVVITQLNKIHPQQIDNKCQQIMAEVPGILEEAGIQINYDPMFFYYHGSKVNGLEKLQYLIETKETFRPEIVDDYKRLNDPQDREGTIDKMIEQNKKLLKVLAEMEEEKQKRLLNEQQQEEKLKLIQKQQQEDKKQREQEALKVKELENKLAQSMQRNEDEKKRIQEENGQLQRKIQQQKEKRKQEKEEQRNQLEEQFRIQSEQLDQKFVESQKNFSQILIEERKKERELLQKEIDQKEKDLQKQKELQQQKETEIQQKEKESSDQKEKEQTEQTKLQQEKQKETESKEQKKPEPKQQGSYCQIF
ncbi:hypothetical protein pb186bvf_020287 [Paramecium bursaria]